MNQPGRVLFLGEDDDMPIEELETSRLRVRKRVALGVHSVESCNVHGRFSSR